MVCLLILMMLTACAASPQDLSGQMFTFPQETDKANVRLNVSTKTFRAVTVCFRSITDLERGHALFSLATPAADNSFVIFKSAQSGLFEINVRDRLAKFQGIDYELNVWNSICSTWDAASRLVQLWVNGKSSIRKFVGGGTINNPIIILGQEQDSYGGGFDSKQSFIGMMSDVHMWNYSLSPCEIQRYMDDLNFTPGNVLNWRALDFQITGRVLVEDRQTSCN